MSFRNVLLGVDQLANTLLGGSPDETLSARAWRLRGTSAGWARAQRIIDAVFMDPKHCEDSYTSEKNRKQLPGEYRD